MKKLFLFVVLLFAPFASAQEATLITPIVKPSEVRKTVGRVDLSRTPLYALVQVNVLDSAGDVVRYYNVSIPTAPGDDADHPTASIGTFVNAIMTSRAGETGGVSRRFDFRVLSYLKDEGYFADANIVP